MKATRGRYELPCGCTIETDVEFHDETVFITAERKFYCKKHDIRSQLVECEKVAEALKSRLDENSNGDLADYDAFDMYEAYKSAHPTEKG